MMHRLLAALLFVVSVVIAPTASAQSAKPSQKVILTVEGAVKTKTNFTLAQLEALGMATIKTSSPWYDGVQTFEGVPMTAIMKAVGATGTTANVVALNRYQMAVPISDFATYGVILATRHNGQPMAVREKGPLFVMYPFDEKPELKNDTYYGRAVWQVRTITVE